MENEKKPGKVKEFWNKHKGKVKVGLTAVAAFTVGALLAAPKKDDRALLKNIHGWNDDTETGNSFGDDFLGVQIGSKACRANGGGGSMSISERLDCIKKCYIEAGVDPDSTEATGMIMFTK